MESGNVSGFEAGKATNFRKDAGDNTWDAGGDFGGQRSARGEIEALNAVDHQ